MDNNNKLSFKVKMKMICGRKYKSKLFIIPSQTKVRLFLRILIKILLLKKGCYKVILPFKKVHNDYETSKACLKSLYNHQLNNNKELLH